VRGIEYGGPTPLFCVPLAAPDLACLLAKARVAREAAPDLVEWRADYYQDAIPATLVRSLAQLRAVLGNVPMIYTLRSGAEGGAQNIPPETRQACIEAAAASGFVDLIDVELGHEIRLLEPLIRLAHDHAVRVILSFHDFNETPGNEALLDKIRMMDRRDADVGKIAVMPRCAGDVLRLMNVTLEARKAIPRLALCTMSMGSLGVLSRVAGFLFGSDMAYAMAQDKSAPGQIPIGEARAIAQGLLRYY